MAYEICSHLRTFTSVLMYCGLLAAVGQHRHHAFEVIFGNERVNIELTLTFRRLLGQNMTRVRMTAFDLSRGGRAKTLRGAFMGFEFWHNSSIKLVGSGRRRPLPTAHYFSFFGEKITVICMPSRRGLNSGAPLSARSFSSLSGHSKPSSLCVISRPRNLTVAFTLFPSARISLACFILKL